MGSQEHKVGGINRKVPEPKGRDKNAMCSGGRSQGEAQQLWWCVLQVGTQVWHVEGRQQEKEGREDRHTGKGAQGQRVAGMRGTMLHTTHAGEGWACGWEVKGYSVRTLWEGQHSKGRQARHMLVV